MPPVRDLHEFCSIINPEGPEPLLVNTFNGRPYLGFFQAGIYRYSVGTSVKFRLDPAGRPLVCSLEDRESSVADGWRASDPARYTLEIQHNDIIIRINEHDLWYILSYDRIAKRLDRYHNIASSQTGFPFRLNKYGEVAIQN